MIATELYVCVYYYVKHDSDFRAGSANKNNINCSSIK